MYNRCISLGSRHSIQSTYPIIGSIFNAIEAILWLLRFCPNLTYLCVSQSFKVLSGCLIHIKVRILSLALSPLPFIQPHVVQDWLASPRRFRHNS